MTTEYSSVTRTLPSTVDDLVLTGTADINGTGNTRVNTITGNAGANVLDGRAGADTLIGGAGNDTYVVDNAGDRVVENADEGVDTVNASVSYTLSDNVENLTLTAGSSGTGNALDNVITGNGGPNTLSGLDGNDTLSGGAGNDTLDGGTGDDTMAGGTGDDTFVVDAAGDSVVEAAGAGTDTVRSHIDYALGDNLENLVLAGTGDLEGRGNLLDNSLTGNSGANALYGGAGDDTLDGGLGADHMEGGVGDDTYVVDDQGDRVIELDGAGIDSVQSSITTTLSEHVENLALSGTAAIDGTGNTLDNFIVGNAGANVLAGLEGNDTLDGGAGVDTMQGGSGNDTYYVDNALDAVVELDGEGVDKVVASVHHTLAANVENLTLAGPGGISGTGNELDNEISGNGVNNALYGLDGDDTLYGNGGHDVLDGGSGADIMNGGIGDDTYVVDQAGDLVVELPSAGTDLVRASIDYTLTDNVEHLTLTGSADLAGTGNVLNNIIEGNAGNNLIAGGAGNDTVRAGDGSDVVDGGDGNDTLNGEGGNDVLFGGAGGDSISGGAGDDHMEGGLGDDTYSVEDAGDLVVEDIGGGTDMVNAGRSYTLTDNVENLTLVGMSDIDGTGNELNNTIYGSGGANLLQGLDGNDTIHANSGNDTLVGGEGNDILNGDTGDDRLQGDAGNDTLNGGAGVDDMAGGTGNDSYTVDNAGDLVHENAGEGVDTVNASVDYTLTSEVENLSLFGFGNIAGSGNELDNTVSGNNAHNQLFGLEGNDTLLGLAGNDTLDGGLGADLMQGGAGDDTYLVDNAGDRVEELANQGNADTVRSEIDYTLTANVENLVLLGTEDLSGTGNHLNNVITGNSGNNTISAGDGLDTVHAGAGNDLVRGGNGNDTLNGEAGEDQLFGDAGNDRLDGGEGADRMLGGLGDDVFIVDNAGDQAMEAAGEGTDIVHASVTTTLLDNVENLLLTGSADIDGNGNELDNVITGNSGANVLDGRAGNDTISAGLGNDLLVGGEGNDVLNGGAGIDTMLGGSGDDTYVVDNAVDLAIEHADEGIDTVQSTVSFTLGDNVENLSLTGSSGINGTGNELNNVITGNSGSNVLDGGAGADTMAGGAGNDTYVVDHAGDVVLEAANGGTDTVESSVDFALGANVEKLVLTGNAHLAGTGNTLANTITGNGGDNLLDGGAGADAMSGGMGDDTYVVDAAGDTVVEAANAGLDTVHAGVSHTLAANVENLVLTGTAALAGNGNALDNTITGNAGNNVLNGMAGDDLIDAGAGNDTLDGGSGADTMLGGAGDDTYLVDDAGDIVIEQFGEGADTVVSSIDYTLGLHLNNLTLVGGALNGTGNTAVNVITGNSADNVLDGAGGKDTLVGGAGNDTYIVDGGDTVVELAGGGSDTVRADTSYTLGAHLENLVLVGTGDLSGTGNELANSMVGNAGANVLDGGAGLDTLAGGAGDDTYLVDATGDLVLEAAGEGADTVLASASYTLGANVEHLVLTGSQNLSGTGNAGDNTITGNGGANVLDGGAGNDTLDGGAGADTLIGGSGDDTYVVDNAGDVVAEAAGNGTDTVLAGASHVLAANVEHLVLTGEANLHGTGNASANTLIGNGGDNQLAGMDGDDLLTGGAGNDVLLGGAGDDTYVFGIGDGMERIVDAQGSGTLQIRGGLTAADLLAEQSGRDLVLTIAASGDSVTLVDWLGQAEGVTRIVFEDGSVIDHGGMAALLNAAPLAADDSIAVQEDGGAVLLPVTQLLANDTDPDLGDVVSVIAVGASSIGADVGLIDGAVAYDLGGRFQELAQGEILNDSFTYTITDEMGETSTAVVNVQVIGANDAAVTVADSAEAFEDAATAVSGNVLANDSDIDRGTVLQVAAPGTIAGVYGSLVIAADGSYTYSLNDGAANVQGLNAGEVVTDTFAYVATDGIEGVASTLAIAIAGTNDAPVLSADAAQVFEDSAVAASGNVLANDSDADSGAVLVVSEPGVYAGAYGILTLARDGSYTYSLDSNAAAVQALAEGQSVIDSFGYAATDGRAVVASTLDITVTGTNDAPLLAADQAQLSEDAAGVSGNVLANDSDADFGATLAAGAATSQGRYGSLALDADGSYRYRLDTAAVQSLGRDASVVDRFSYGAGDGLASGQSTLDITVAGANDAPIVVVPLADQGLTFNKAFSFKLPADSFKDLDQGDTLSYSASLADGSELPAWLKFDAKTGSFSGTTPKQVGAIEVRVTATDQVGATGSTEGSLSASDVFTLSVSHGNEGVGNGEDAAPGGHDSNQNDGPGTGPGNPGSKGGKNLGIAIGVSASNGVASVSVAATAQTTDALGVPALLSASKIVEFSLPASSIGNTTSAQSFGAWLKVDLAVSEALAEKKSLTWLDERNGADTGVLAKATLGFLGSTLAFGGGGLSLSGSAGVELKGFEGLGKGTKKLK